MTEPEKMEALKRAYAEMILNTAKEAAARVLAAEFRSRQLEQDLVSSKDDAAWMLLRLKQMIDAKTKDADMALLNQQRKSDELEAQLNEAEGIILDLRAELNETQEQLVEVKKMKLPCTMQKENTEVHKMTPKHNDYQFSTSSLDSGPGFITIGCNNSCLDWSTLNHECCSPSKQNMKFTPECDVYSHENHPVLDQTQETSLVQQRFPVGDISNPGKNLVDVEIVNAVESTSVLEEKVHDGKIEAVSVVRRSLRKRKLKYWDDVIAACGSRRSNQFKKPCQASPQLARYNTSKVKSGEDQFQSEDWTMIDDGPEELIHTEALPEKMELIDVLVKQDSLL